MGMYILHSVNHLLIFIFRYHEFLELVRHARAYEHDTQELTQSHKVNLIVIMSACY
jgi:hypothetical protein